MDALLPERCDFCYGEGRSNIRGQVFVPAFHGTRINSHGLDGTDACDSFDKEGLVVRTPRELAIQTGAQHRCNDGGDDGVEWQRQHHYQREPAAVHPHDRQEHAGEQQVQDRCKGLAGQEGANAL
ncbi:hypothetical protein D3C81_1855880 [compost metagenome]